MARAALAKAHQVGGRPRPHRRCAGAPHPAPHRPRGPPPRPPPSPRPPARWPACAMRRSSASAPMRCCASRSSPPPCGWPTSRSTPTTDPACSPCAVPRPTRRAAASCATSASPPWRPSPSGCRRPGSPLAPCSAPCAPRAAAATAPCPRAPRGNLRARGHPPPRAGGRRHPRPRVRTLAAGGHRSRWPPPAPGSPICSRQAGGAHRLTTAALYVRAETARRGPVARRRDGGGSVTGRSVFPAAAEDGDAQRYRAAYQCARESERNRCYDRSKSPGYTHARSNHGAYATNDASTSCGLRPFRLRDELVHIVESTVSAAVALEQVVDRFLAELAKGRVGDRHSIRGCCAGWIPTIAAEAAP